MDVRERADLNVTGMTCASCVARVRDAVDSLEGVERAEVNLATNRAVVDYDPEIVDLSDLSARIEALGYGASPVGAETDADEAATDDTRDRRRVVTALVGGVVVMALSMIPGLRFDGWEWVAGAIATPVVWWSGWTFHSVTLRNLAHRTATMDTLVSIGSVAAWTWSVAAVVGLASGHVWFETSTMIVALVLVGRAIESRMRRRAGDALSELGRLAVPDVTLVDGTTVAADALRRGDRFRVAPGDRIATDGVVVEGRAAVDQSALTGEPIPVAVEAGSDVLGGSVNGSSPLVVEATRVGHETVLARVVSLVEEAQSTTPPIQRLVDRVAAVFVPIVLVLSALTLAVWLATGQATDESVAAAVAVLVVACPCAMGLATPMALMVGTGRGAQLGMIIRTAEVLEDTRRIDTVMVDKTGTLTVGRPGVNRVELSAGTDRDQAVAWAAALAADSTHPVAGAIAELADGTGTAPVADLNEEPGVGLTGTIDGQAIALGRRSLFSVVPDDLDRAEQQAAAEGCSVSFVGPADRAVAAIVVSDTVKPTSSAAIARLHGLGLEVVVLTGDSEQAARAVGRSVGADRVVAEVLPDAKADEVRRLQAEGRVVAMVGDGINDGPALAHADLGVAIGGASAVAVEAADITVVSDDLGAVPSAIELSRRVLGTIRANLFWAFAYNVAAIPLAMTGLVAPMVAAGAMALSSIFVVTNSLRLRRFGTRPAPTI